MVAEIHRSLEVRIDKPTRQLTRPFPQDFGQIEDLYGCDGASTFFCNADAQIFFGNIDAPTLDYISKQIGIRYDAGAFNADKEIVGKPHMSPGEVRAHVAKKESDAVSRRMIVFAKGSDILSLRLAPYFQGRNIMRKIILEVAWWSVLMAVGLMIWVYVGADNRASHWEWELRPYVAFWDKHITGFISGDGAPYATLLYVVAAIFLLLLSFRLLVFVAKLVLGFTIAQTALFTMGTQGIWQPALALYGAAGVSVAWLVASMFIQKIGIGQGFRNLWRQIRS